MHKVGRRVVVSHPSRRRLFPSATYNNRTQQRTIVAITRALPDTFADALQEFSTKETTTTTATATTTTPPPLCLATCRAQHAAYVRVLQQHVENVVTLPALNAFPDSVFVEDTMVAVGGEVVLTRPGHESRVGEVQYMQEALLQHPHLRDRVTILDDMRSPRRQRQRRHGHNDDDDDDEVPTCDGGDILRLGDHTMLVGMSHRTNAAGYRVLQRAFPRLDVLPIPAVVQGSAALHLKSVTTNLNDRAILVPSGPLGDLIVKALHDALAAVHHHRKNIITKNLAVYRLDDMFWCNVVALPGTVLAQEGLNDRSRTVLERACTEQNLDLVLVDTSALAVKDAALTCCSVLVDL